MYQAMVREDFDTGDTELTIFSESYKKKSYPTFLMKFITKRGAL
jgi:hypothetical protein